MRKIGASLKIHCEQLIGSSARIELEGIDITHCLMGIELSMASDDITRATLKICIDDLDVAAETLVMLQAYLKK
jgi:hypothetical protein